MMHNKLKLQTLARDPVIWFALIGALIFWFFLSLISKTTVNWSWPVTEPYFFLLVVLVYPILEEIVFRGVILEFLHTRIKGNMFGGISKANMLTSIIFVAMHFFYHPIVWASAVIIPSLIFGYLKEKYASLLPPILLHIFFNLGYYWLFSHTS